MKPAYLGGGAAPTAHASVPVAEAVVLKHEQHPQSRQWLMTVKLEGGRLVRGVQVLTTGDGLASGNRARLPAPGTNGVVFWPSFTRNSRRVIWLGSLDSFDSALDQDDPGESVSVLPTGAGEALSKTGGRTTRLPSGDTLFAGPLEESPHEFRLRERRGDTLDLTPFPHKDVRGRALDPEPDQHPLRYELDGARNTRRVAFGLRQNLGRIVADEKAGEAALLAHDGEAPERKRRVFFQGRAGKDWEWGADSDAGHARARGDAERGEMRLSVQGSSGKSAAELRGNDAYLDADLTRVGRPGHNDIPVASAPPTLKNDQDLAAECAWLRAQVAWHHAAIMLITAGTPGQLALSATAAIGRVPQQKVFPKPVASFNLRAGRAR